MTPHFDPKELFDTAYVKFFDEAPKAAALKAGELGVNIDIFRQVKVHYRKAKENSAARVLADICQDIQIDGYIGGLEDSALRVGMSYVTVQRWRSRFYENGLLDLHNRNGLYSVNPKMAILKGADGKVIKPRSSQSGVFTF
ncbi:hypothetical protein [Litoreibacter roseus]|uniref:Helix-turn-helix domain-containing protein n=1 Tax=Litoreibacter roseus TaxID=2601869 RepID=A0A6N6JL48_9RHOB|nr:hypothetical protein [Litoreibacter roseus]GFE67033.1 hypothetical protein KIN_41070 [Litoreibacter roseus]